MRAFAPDGVDVVLEVAHGANHDLDVAVLAPGGPWPSVPTTEELGWRPWSGTA